MQKYNKFCTADTLIRYIQQQTKDQQALHVLLAIFRKPLQWLQQTFDDQCIYDTIPKMSIREGPIQQQLIWIYVIKGTVTYHQMPFNSSQFIVLNDYQVNNLQTADKSVFAVLTKDNYMALKHCYNAREKQRIVKFIKNNVFYPYYMEDEFANQFSQLMRTKKLEFNKSLNWKDEDGSNKIGVIYKGVLSIQYQWKRNIQICEITKGMFFTNHYIKDYIEEIQQYQRQPVDHHQTPTDYFKKIKYVSKSDQTVLLIFNIHLISESPYNINQELKTNIKKQFNKYTQQLEKILGNSDYNKLHRNKKSMKEEIKKRKEQNQLKKQITVSVNQHAIKTSPIIDYFSTIQLQSKNNPFQTISQMRFPQTPKQFSKSVFTTIPNRSPTKLIRSKTTEINPSSFSNRKLVHNTWVEQTSKKKKKHIRSFSTLQTLSTYRPENSILQQTLNADRQAQKKPAFFVPDQFVKRKLKIKYESLIGRMRNLDLTIKKQNQETLAQKMTRLQQYIDSKRIVKLNTLKTKHKLLRDKVDY